MGYLARPVLPLALSLLLALIGMPLDVVRVDARGLGTIHVNSWRERSLPTTALPVRTPQSILRGSQPGVPNLVQCVSGSSSVNVNSININGEMTIHLPSRDGTKAGNCLIVTATGWRDSGTVTTFSVSDDKTNTYVAGPTDDSVGDGLAIFLFYALNVAAGTRVIKLKNTSGVTCSAVQMTVHEFTNVATSGANDGSNHNDTGGGSGSAITAGNITPTQSGDLLFQFSAKVGPARFGNNPVTSWVAGSQAKINWHLSCAGLVSGCGCQWGVYTSTTTINPAMTGNSADSWLSCAIALKSAQSGSDNGTRLIDVVGVYHNFLDTNSPTTQTVQFPCFGNLIVLAFVGGSINFRITGVTDNVGNFWKNVRDGSSIQGAGVCQFWYLDDRQSFEYKNLFITYTIASTSAGHGTLLCYDVINAHQNPYQGTVGIATGVQSVAGNLADAPIITPDFQGVIFAEMGQAFNTTTGMTSAGHLVDSIFYDGEGLSGGPMDENNAWGHYFNPENTTVHVGWSFADGVTAIDAWSAYAAAFNAAAVPTRPVQSTQRGDASYW